MLPLPVGPSTVRRKLPWAALAWATLALAVGAPAAASPCDGIDDIRSLRLALAEPSCGTVTLAGELPTLSVPLLVERDVILDESLHFP